MGSGISTKYEGTYFYSQLQTKDQFVAEKGLPLNEVLDYDPSRIVELPENDSNLHHIFRDSHNLADTLENRKMIIELVNDSSKYLGRSPKTMNDWSATILKDGTQLWASFRNGIIQDGGRNRIPIDLITIMNLVK